MILGVGIDVVDVSRFEEALDRTPTLRERLFTDQERGRPMNSLAARFAAKEALAKALGAPTGMSWHDAEICNEHSGDPQFELRGSVLARANERGVSTVHVSLSHDAGIASAMVVLEGRPR
jgi:holo-[acyl-carrier protein] synthase